MNLDRREFLASAGALVVSFSIPLPAGAQVPNPKLDDLDAWLAVGSDGKVTMFCGKVELGTGIQTALAQIVADELDVAFERVHMIMGDTALCQNQGPTVGSQSIPIGGPQLRQAAAEARHTLVGMAAGRLGAPADKLSVSDGVVSAPGAAGLSYAELLGNRRFERKLDRKVKPKAPSALKVVGRSIPRVDLPGKVFGAHAYVQNLRLPGMVHGRVVRPPRQQAVVARVDESSVKGLPGNVRVARKGNFVAVVADREEQAIAAARALKVEWSSAAQLPEMKDLPAAVKATPAAERVLAEAGNVNNGMAGAAKTLRAEYFIPFQLHASIGPSCALADVRSDGVTLWSPTQSSFNVRDGVATLLGRPASQVRLIWVEGSGCYGQNGSDDATADAALLSQLVGKPVRVQWMRHDENVHEPMAPAMAIDVRGGLDRDGGVVAWDYLVRSPNHGKRPAFGMAGNMIAGAELGMPERYGVVGADRNAKHSYQFAHNRVRFGLMDSSVLRNSSLRGLGSPQNTLANESFMDELAAAAGADPIAFRIRHLKDPRAIAVLEEVAKLSRWDTRPSPRKDGTGAVRDRGAATGRGVAFAQYNNIGAYVALVVHLRIERKSGKVRADRVFVAHDCGLIVNPDGLRNQIEGNVIQGLSRALLEEVQFDRGGVKSVDWRGYPIMRFSDMPEEIGISLINRPEQPAQGGGEPAGSPILAAVANAIFDATGARLRSVPFAPERVRAAIA